MVQPLDWRLMTEATFRAKAAEQDSTLNNFGTRVKSIETLGGLAPGDVSDATATSLMAQSASGLRKETHKHFVGKGELVINVKDHGVKGDGTTDDAAAINTLIGTAPEGARIFFPAGNYRTTAEIMVARNVDIDMAGVIRADHDGTGITFHSLGLGTSFNARHRVSVRKTTLNHSAPDSIGIKVYGCYNQSFDIQYVSQFTVGMLLTAPFGKGCVYNQFSLQTMYDNLVGIRLYGQRTGATDAELQWPNQNTFIGGRISWSPNSGPRSGAVGIQIGTSATGQAAPNGNAFFNVSIEDVGKNGEFARPVECFGTHNTFIATRMEGGLNPTFRAGSHSNRWIGGLYGDVSSIVDEGNLNTLESVAGGKHWSTMQAKQVFRGSGGSAAITAYSSFSDTSDAIEFLGTDGVTKVGGISPSGKVSFRSVTHQYGLYNGAPTSGTWKRGDVVWHATPAAGGNMGWVCVTAGTPGTWKTFGTIGP